MTSLAAMILDYLERRMPDAPVAAPVTVDLPKPPGPLGIPGRYKCVPCEVGSNETPCWCCGADLELVPA